MVEKLQDSCGAHVELMPQCDRKKRTSVLLMPRCGR